MTVEILGTFVPSIYAESIIYHEFSNFLDQMHIPHKTPEVLERLETVKIMGGVADKRDVYLKDYWDVHLAHAKKSDSEPMMKRMVSLARGIPGVAVSPDDIDNQPWLFNVHGATIDLRTGKASEPDPGDLLMQRADVMYDASAVCPMWEGYLAEWQENEEVRLFLQKVCASAITGIPLSKLFINVGSGANGKSVFFDALTDILGTYAIVPDESLFMDSRNETHSEEKAKLKGARMMVVNETDRTGRLNEPAVKKYNGGDKINARHLYGRPFSFKPTHSSFMHTNHKPSISGTDLGVWRRVEIIEWNFTVEASKRDPLIGEKLKTEYSGILNWLIAGVPMFVSDMTISQVPDVIKRVGEEYRKEQDHVGNFLRDVYEGGFLSEPASMLRQKYEMWCQSQGFKAWTAPNVGKELTSRHYVSKLVRTDGKPTRTWVYEGFVTEMTYTESAVTSVTPLQNEGAKGSEGSNPEILRYTEIASDQGFDTKCNGVTVDSYLNDMGGIETETIKALIESSVSPLHRYTEPDEEYWEEQERQWRIDAGFDVTGPREVSDRELAELAEMERLDWEQMNKPSDWV